MASWGSGRGPGPPCPPRLDSYLNLYFLFFSPGFTKQGGTFSCLEMVSIESDIPIDAMELKETISPNVFLLSFNVSHH